jgi:hypothetical protein
MVQISQSGHIDLITCLDAHTSAHDVSYLDPNFLVERTDKTLSSRWCAEMYLHTPFQKVNSIFIQNYFYIFSIV